MAAQQQMTAPGAQAPGQQTMAQPPPPSMSAGEAMTKCFGQCTDCISTCCTCCCPSANVAEREALYDAAHPGAKEIRNAPRVRPTGPQQECPKCQGMGWVHESTLNHIRDACVRCPVCEDCRTCGGFGTVAATTTTVVAGPTVVHSGGLVGVGVVQPVGIVGGTVTSSGGKQPCFKCHGHGWVHESSMDHDKPQDVKCFFCETCSGCRGSGAIAGGSSTTVVGGPVGVVGVGGVGVGVVGGTVTSSGGKQACFKCNGHGWVHESSMDHDKPRDVKCFFCETCSGCKGRGAIEGGSSTTVVGGPVGVVGSGHMVASVGIGGMSATVAL